ncbi:MAG TPA: hypothetical protein VGY48_15380 [Vicinamibacterales bacterium]|jgi:hypothetical protein|nr:hypothetical protein [Vicinamibacterales bacterium]
MAAEHVQVPCPGCGFDRTLARLGINADGTFVASDRWALEARVRTYGGRGKLTCEHRDVSVQIALGLRDMLRTRLGQVEAELRAAGIDC